MEGALLILGVLVAVGFVLYIMELRYRRKNRKSEGAGGGDNMVAGSLSPESAESENTDGQEAEPGAEECCGMHLVCEKDSLSPMSAEVVYYDDEELDRFVGRSGDDYSAEETEEFREVLMTLRPEDVSGWARSITQRRLQLPPDVRDELLLLVNEQRNVKI